jgi:hypothetical protein
LFSFPQRLEGYVGFFCKVFTEFFYLQMTALAAANVSGGPKTPTGITRHKSERERKIGHRRVGVGGEITYKKVCSLGLI